MNKAIRNKIKTKLGTIIIYKDGTSKLKKNIVKTVKHANGNLVVYEDGTNKKTYNKPGRPLGSKNRPTYPTNLQLTLFWLSRYNEDNTCTICHNTGVIDTIAVNNSLNICICPIGREMIQSRPLLLKEYLDAKLKG